MEPRVSKRERKLHLSYELFHRTHSAELYPKQAPNGSTVIIYGHDRGLRVLWRGGRRRKGTQNSASQANGKAHDRDAIVIDDDDDEPGQDQRLLNDQPEDEEDERDPDCSFPSIFQEVDVELGTEVLHLAVASLPTSLRRTHALNRHAAVAVACSDGSQRVLAFDLLSPADAQKQDYVQGILGRQIQFEPSDTSCTGLAAKIVTSDSAHPTLDAHSTDFLLVAAISNTLRFYRFAIFEDLSHVSQDAQAGVEHLPYAAKSVSFHPSMSSTSVLLSDVSGAVRVYDALASKVNSDGSSVEGERIRQSHPESPGKWLFTFTTSYTSNGSSLARRKQVLDASWVLSGNAILALLEDGEWVIWSLKPDAQTGGNVGDFVLRGFLDASTAGESSHSSKRTRSAARLAPMTPNTRRVKAENFFAGPAKVPGVAAHGGISVATSSIRAGQTDESVILWYNTDIYTIPSLHTFWQRSTSRTSGSLGSLYAPGLTHITDINLMNEAITSISQFAPSAANSGVGQMNTQRDILVSAEHRLIILQTLRPPTPARLIFQQVVAERPASCDQGMLDAGQLDVGGMDRMLDSMANGDARPRRVGFAH